MRWSAVAVAILLLVLDGCGAGGGAQDAAAPTCPEYSPATFGGDPWFLPPSQTTEAYARLGNLWELQGNADWSCLCAPTDERPASVDLTVQGVVRDSVSRDPIGPANIAAFGWRDDQAIDDTTTDESGEYAVSLPSGSASVAFRVSDPSTSRFLDTVHLRPALLPDVAVQDLDLDVMTQATLVMLPAFIGVMYKQGFGLAGGAVVDCRGDRVANAVVTISDAPLSTVHVDGAVTYYYSAGMTASTPVRHTTSATTNRDGLFLILDVPERADAYIQAWGYVEGQTPGTDEMTLLSEVRTTVEADRWMFARMAPRRAE